MKQENETYGVERIWRNTVYTYVRLAYDPRTKDELAPILLPYVAQLETVRNSQWECWKALLSGHAKVEGTDVRLDDTVNRHGATCQFWKTTGTKGKDRYDLFYEEASPAKVINMRLEKELKHTASWLSLLENDVLPEMKAFSVEFTELHKDGKEALEERSTAQNGVKVHRSTVIEPLVEGLNKARKKIHLALQQIASDRDLPVTWAESFFRKQKAAAADDPLERRREAILSNLSANEIDVFDEFVEVLDTVEEEAQLKTWMVKAAQATTMEGFLTEIGLALERRKK